uniref:Uncharacterized protein n=1 Tax=Sphaerodactylus townsendi TaxID=933632 RepID=A0ACB8G521_9SAUR
MGNCCWLLGMLLVFFLEGAGSKAAPNWKRPLRPQAKPQLLSTPNPTLKKECSSQNCESFFINATSWVEDEAIIFMRSH